jgi:NADH-quinone oxidoreductase subunit H
MKEATHMITELFQALVFPGFAAAFIFGFLYQGVLRKTTARMQSRRGPPVWQPFIDFAKLMTKENIEPADSFGPLMAISPVISFAAALTVVLFLPIGGAAVISFGFSLFLVIYLLILSGVFFALGGLASSSPFGSLGAAREIMQMISIEFPFIISLVTAGVLTNFTVRPLNMLQFPFAFIAFIVCLQARLALPPFHIQDAEQEVVAGPLTEYSGPRLAMAELGKATTLWVMISLGAVLFLGADSLITFAAGSIILFAIVILARVVFARLKLDQSFRLFWLVIGPLAVIDLVRVLLGLYV